MVCELVMLGAEGGIGSGSPPTRELLGVCPAGSAYGSTDPVRVALEPALPKPPLLELLVLGLLMTGLLMLGLLMLPLLMLLLGIPDPKLFGVLEVLPKPPLGVLFCRLKLPEAGVRCCDWKPAEPPAGVSPGRCV